MKDKKTILLLTIIFGIILFTEILIDYLFPRLTFVNGNLVITNRVLGYFAFSFFFLGLLIVLKASKIATFPIGIVLLSFFLVNSCSEIYPIDTTTESIDVLILQTKQNGNKLIVREYKNVKTNQVIRDTVLVKDDFIFRQILESKIKEN